MNTELSDCGSSSKAECMLPPRFSDLLPFLDWAIPLEADRNAKRAAASLAELNRTYEALQPRVEAIMKYLDTFSFDTPLPPPEMKLFLLGIAFMEISHPVELKWDAGNNRNGFPVSRLQLPVRY